MIMNKGIVAASKFFQTDFNGRFSFYEFVVRFMIVIIVIIRLIMIIMIMSGRVRYLSLG